MLQITNQEKYLNKVSQNWGGGIKIENDRINSANVQAELYRRLRARDINCRLEYTYQNCRFDLVVIVDGYIVALTECKNTKTKLFPNKNGRQYKKYSLFGLPLLYCLNMDEIDDTVKLILVVLQRVYNAKIGADKEFLGKKKKTLKKLPRFLQKAV
jgi:hypothetical protein